MSARHYRYADVGGHRLFYREAGPAGAPVLVLLHGFPASSFMFRDLIPLLAGRYHSRGRDLLAGRRPLPARKPPGRRGRHHPRFPRKNA